MMIKFPLNIKHFEEYIKNSPYHPKMNISFYDKKWNWLNIEIRRSLKNELMLIVPFNPQSLTQVNF